LSFIPGLTVMTTVIIPALNEANTIEYVVNFCRQCPLVTEVIVVDDQSEDNTAALAKQCGAEVIISKARGKGISMKEGILASSNEIIVFLDADINPYPEKSIENLVAPLQNEEIDFVKGAFARNAGRVTELVAKPLLNILFPGLYHFSQPLSGMIAGKKSFFKKIEFANDYGVDIGILLDMYLMQAKVKEVNIGYIENKSKPWEALGKMSKEVSRAILSKARGSSTGIFSEADFHSLETINREMNKVLRENISGYHKMAIFDMDDTILHGRFINECAKKFGFLPQLDDLRAAEKDPIILTKRIGLLLKGRSMDELLQVASGIEIVDDCKQVISDLKSKGYIIGIISNSYTLITNYIKQKIDADFSLAYHLEMIEGKASGEVNLPSYFFGSPQSACGHAFCKTNAMQYVCEQYNVSFKNTIAMGDSADDRCMVGQSGKGFAFVSTDELLNKIAFGRLKERSFSPILAHI
jgi:glucosyl-3-phosphoglycerate synthase